jgi:hypothetical protein
MPSHQQQQQECAPSSSYQAEAKPDTNGTEAEVAEQQAASKAIEPGPVTGAPSMGFSFGFKL